MWALSSSGAWPWGRASPAACVARCRASWVSQSRACSMPSDGTWLRKVFCSTGHMRRHGHAAPAPHGLGRAPGGRPWRRVPYVAASPRRSPPPPPPPPPASLSCFPLLLSSLHCLHWHCWEQAAGQDRFGHAQTQPGERMLGGGGAAPASPQNLAGTCRRCATLNLRRQQFRAGCWCARPPP